MAAKLSKKDIRIIIALAEYRIMTVRQMEVLYPGNRRVLRGKLKKFAEQNLIHIGSSPYAGKRGRPADVFSIGQGGFELLRAEKILKADIPYERVKEITAHGMAHMLAINDFRVQLIQAEKMVPDLRITFLSPDSPFIKQYDDGRPMVHERFPVDRTDTKWIGYTPDGVFIMRCTETKKTLLFFLEVDMATESLVSGKGYEGSIEEKIINYQLTYKLGRYKRYESFFKCRLRGFRLLFVTSNLKNLANISKLATQMPPTEFINITDMKSLASKGVWSSIWHKGGRLDLRPISILGSKTPKYLPAPDEID